MSKSVIVIGGGLSGRETVKSLVALKKAKKLDASITLVEASPTYESDLGMPNGITDAGIEKYETNFSAAYFKLHVDGVKNVKGKVTSVTSENGKFTVVVDNSTTPLFADSVVVATGFSTGLIKKTPAKLSQSNSDRLAELRKFRASIKSADNVLVAGGGYVGIEMAGKVKGMLKPNATVTLVASGEKLLTPRHTERERDLITKRLKGTVGVKLMLGNRVTGDGASEAQVGRKAWTLEKGGEVVADVFIPAWANWDRNGFLDESLLKNGMVAVDKETMMSVTVKGLFAVGCSDNGEMCAIPKIPNQALSASIGVNSFLKGETVKPCHKEGAPMIKVEHVLMFDNYGVTMIDNLGAVGKCCWCCGFPFPCCFAPCAPFPCGLCGTSCSRPEGESLPKFFEAWMLKGPFGPVLEEQKKEAVAPNGWGMDRD